MPQPSLHGSVERAAARETVFTASPGKRNSRPCPRGHPNEIPLSYAPSINAAQQAAQEPRQVPEQ